MRVEGASRLRGDLKGVGRNDMVQFSLNIYKTESLTNEILD
jgi:hypothetical protein